MKFKKLVVLIGVLAVLVGIGVFKKARFEKGRSANPAVLLSELVTEQNFSSGFVTKVDIRHGLSDDDLLIFNKNESGQWVLENRYGTRVRKESVEPLLKQLSSLRGEIRSEGKNVFDDFYLTDEKAVHVRLYGAGDSELIHALISPVRPGGRQNFVRLSNAERIFVTGTDLLSTLGIFSKTDKLNYRAFADLRVTHVDSSKVRSFELAAPGEKTLRFVKNEEAKDPASSWFLSDDSAVVVDTGKVKEFLSAIQNLYAQESLDPAVHVKDFSAATEPWLRVHMKSEEKPESVEIWTALSPEEKKTALVRVMPEAMVYELADSRSIAILKKNKQSFLKDSAPLAPVTTAPTKIEPAKAKPAPAKVQKNTFSAKRKKS